MRVLISPLLAAALVSSVTVRTHFARQQTAAKGTSPAPRTAADEAAMANDNRVPAGARVGDTLTLRLTVRPALWYILGDSNPAFRVAAFVEEGKAPSIPGPLVRVRLGTPIHIVLRNPLGDTLVLRGLSARGGALDSLVVPPNSAGEVRFIAGRAGTHQYWGALAEEQRALPPTLQEHGLVRPRFDSQLAGAFIVDPPGPVGDDRILVITEIADQRSAVGQPSRDRNGVPVREFAALNGRSWPYTERLRYGVGDTVRWRIINTTFQTHPMHLHGFYFRVDSHGSALSDVDSMYTPAQRRMAVTESIGIGENVSIVWSPDRPGGWIFHCHLTNHAAKLPPVDRSDVVDYPIAHHGDPDHHVVNGMNGLIIGMTVVGKQATSAPWHPTRQLRLFVQSDSTPGDSTRRFGYVLQRGAEPPRDSVESPGPVLLLTRGEPTSIEVVNRTAEPTAVHWHGIEIESYYDGAVGWSSSSRGTAPAIRPNSSFEVRITPKRAGTFMYHTHFNEMRQHFGGLVGPLIVLEPGERWDPVHDLLFVVSDGDRGRAVINGSAAPLTRDLRVGTTYRIRIADIAGFRQNLFARIVRDSALASWRPVAKDGFRLPNAQATIRPSVARVTSGETADFEFTPEAEGELRLEIGVPTRGGGVQIQGAVRLHVAAP